MVGKSAWARWSPDVKKLVLSAEWNAAIVPGRSFERPPPSANSWHEPGGWHLLELNSRIPTSAKEQGRTTCGSAWNYVKLWLCVQCNLHQSILCVSFAQICPDDPPKDHSWISDLSTLRIATNHTASLRPVALKENTAVGHKFCSPTVVIVLQKNA